MIGLPLFNYLSPPPGPRDGETFDRDRDGARLAAQEQRVFNIMRDGAWLGLREIAAMTGDPEASVSARLRGLRHEGHTIERKYISRGLWHYRMLLGAHRTIAEVDADEQKPEPA